MLAKVVKLGQFTFAFHFCPSQHEISALQQL